MKLNLENITLKQNELYAKDYRKKIVEVHKKLQNPDHSAGTTWVHYPEQYDQKEFAKLQKLAKEIRSKADALLVVGIGGSYLGAKAGIDMLTPKKNGVEIIFSGITFDYNDLAKKLEYLKNKDVYVNIVSKSGTTGSPYFCTSTFSLSSFPIGTLGSIILGIVIIIFRILSSRSFSIFSNSSKRTAPAATCFFTSSASSFFF